mmetsp:Transcript_54993/g.128326  ORF Transcript_54993/g.128326 Transcript_54993/m.128326 type:complete len:542 (-) Transcript_54993:553-2178(-)
MDLMGISRFHNQGNLGPQLLGNEGLVHSANGQKGAHGHTALVRPAVRQDQDGGPVAQNRRLGLLADLVQALLEQVVASGSTVRLTGTGLGLIEAVGHVQDHGWHAVSLKAEEGVVAARAQDGGIQKNTSTGLRRRLQEPPLRANRTGQRHDIGLTDWVDGWVCRLGKELEEVVERLAGHARHACQGDVRAHRAQWLSSSLDHRGEKHLHLLVCVACVGQEWDHSLVHQGDVRGVEAARLLIKKVLNESSIRLRLWPQSVLNLDAVLFQVVCVRLLFGITHLEFAVLNELSLREVHEQHLARTQAAFEFDIFLWHIHHAHLRGQDEPLVLGDVEAAWSETVAVQRGAELDTVGEADKSRTIPRLHQARQILVEGLLFGLHAVRVLPGLRDYHHDHLSQVTCSSSKQQLHHVVQEGRVTADVLVHREECVQGSSAEGRRVIHQRLACADGVPVAGQSVDLTVVGNASERVSTVPGREGVCGEPRVHNGKEGRAAFCLEVQVILEKLVGFELPFVHNCAGRKGAHEDFPVAQCDGTAEQEKPGL